MLFGNENRLDENRNSGTGTNVGARIKLGQSQMKNNDQTNSASNKLLDLLRSSNVNINRNDLINALKTTTRSELGLAVNSLLSQEMNQSNESVSSSTIAASSTSSLASLSSQPNRQHSHDLANNTANDVTISEKLNEGKLIKIKFFLLKNYIFKFFVKKMSC